MYISDNSVLSLGIRALQRDRKGERREPREGEDVCKTMAALRRFMEETNTTL